MQGVKGSSEMIDKEFVNDVKKNTKTLEPWNPGILESF
jgi:hypothetical protein